MPAPGRRSSGRLRAATGLTLSTGGALAGTPTTQGSFNFVVQVQDTSATPLVYQASFALTVNGNPSAGVSIMTSTLPQGSVGRSYQAQLAAAGGAPASR